MAKSVPVSPALADKFLPYGQILALLLVPRMLSASYNLIHDADETYNYWEPLHFLLHGSGFQTWEYSPIYAIRSWTYIALHAIPLWPLKYMLSELQQFYLLRGCLGFASALTESFLVTTAAKYLGRDIGTLTLVGLLSSTGLFNASTAFLPSSFTMYTSTLGLAFSIRKQYFAATFTFGIGTVLGWPFSALLFIPVVVLSLLDSEFPIFSFVRGFIASLQVLLPATVYDYTRYHIWTLVPLNIVLYNVFAAREGRGPDLFGTEPVSYYFRNLLLNFNLLFPAAILAVPLTLLAGENCKQRTKASLGFLLWFVVFSAQPHKEERFMYPVYPALVLSAAISIASLRKILQPVDNFITEKLSLRKNVLLNAGQSLVMLTAVSMSILRTTLMIGNYSAPLALFPSLAPGQSYCMGGDWYRFPTSFLLPKNATLSFIESDFRGLLPGKFFESWSIPTGMNDLNVWEADKVVPLSNCDALISWTKEASATHKFHFVDRETGIKEKGYYGVDSLAQESNADRLNRLGVDLFGRKLDKDGKRFEDGELAGAIQRESHDLR